MQTKSTARKGPVPQTPEAIFWRNVIKSDGCWGWRGSVRRRYPIICYCPEPNVKKMAAAHRLSYEIHNGPIPEDLFVCHSCDNPLCTNPEHLWLGTQSANMADMHAKGRHAHAGAPTVNQGESHWNSKMTEQQVREIRERFAAGGVTHKELAGEYGVRPNAIAKIVRRERWANVS